MTIGVALMWVPALLLLIVLLRWRKRVREHREIRVLLCLVSRGPMPGRRLREFCNLPRGVVYVLLNEMERKNLIASIVIRKPDRRDALATLDPGVPDVVESRRVYLVTPEGARLLTTGRP